jgi:FAD/FMN-containing dehydrogenase
VKTGVIEYQPEDMTLTAEADMTLDTLQAELARHGQWLPLDPPHADNLTLADLINHNASGPRRFGYGTVRDYLIGIAVKMADGTVIHSGGKVVKNVAGYDLMKLFIGARGSLGTVRECTFKLRPLPEMEQFTAIDCLALEQADGLIEAVIQSNVTPVVVDLHNLPTKSESSGGTTFTVMLGFAGTREEVEWQLARVSELGFDRPGSLDYETEFWQDPAPAHRISVLPSKIVEAVRGLQSLFVARAGNGIIYHRGLETPHKEKLPLELLRRVKAAYDPKNILPAMPL